MGYNSTMQELKDAIKAASKDLFDADIEPELERPAEQFGDYSSNVALQLAGRLNNPPAGGPRQIAEALARNLRDAGQFEEVTVAGPGFINFRLSDQSLAATVANSTDLPRPLANQTVVAEYSDPNPFKVLHAGHLYTTLVGDAIASLLEAAGATVHRVNFGGDVGLHVGKTMWAIVKELGGENPEKLNQIPKKNRLDWLSELYVQGNSAYEDNPAAKEAIMEMNKKVYEMHAGADKTLPLAQIYWTCRQWSYQGFEDLYAKLKVHQFEKYYPESQTTELGIKTVQQGLEKGVLVKSEGAVVFEGEQAGLHTRVFITSKGLPTYETKDLGLALAKWDDYHFDQSLMITGNEILEYMQVVLEVLRNFRPEIAQRTTHLTHGQIKLPGGQKMSSRKGNILRAEDILEAAAQAHRQAFGKSDPDVEIGAVKYSFLKQRIGSDIIYDPQESVNLQGNSGPYLQYAFARANSILQKSSVVSRQSSAAVFAPAERSLARKISEYPEVAARATQELMPHHVANYLYELAQTFNHFYEHNRVVDDPREAARLWLVEGYAKVLKNGLNLLGIEAPEKV